MYLFYLQLYFQALRTFFLQNRSTELFPPIATSVFVKFFKSKNYLWALSRYFCNGIFVLQVWWKLDNPDVQPLSVFVICAFEMPFCPIVVSVSFHITYTCKCCMNRRIWWEFDGTIIAIIYWMRLSRIWRILQIEAGVYIHQGRAFLK